MNYLGTQVLGLDQGVQLETSGFLRWAWIWLDLEPRSGIIYKTKGPGGL